MIAQNKLLGLVQSRHPEYRAAKPHWDFMMACYVGGRAWFNGNIFPYHKEGEDEFAARVARAYRFNHTREVVDLVNKYLFRSQPKRNVSDASEVLRAFWENIDGSGVKIGEFTRSVSLASSIYGCPWVIVDSRQGAVSSKKDDVESPVYAYIVHPQNVLDMSWGDDGRLNWILVQEVHRDDKDPFEGTKTTQPRYRLWTRDKWYQIESKANRASVYHVANEGEHNLGRVPAVRADNVMSDEPWIVPAIINDVAYLDRAVANYLSNLDAIIQDQTFSQLAIPAQNLMPGDDTYKKVLEMGTKRVFIYDGEHGAGPQFLSPDPRQAELIISAIRQLINEIYHSVGLAGERTKEDNSQGIDNSSGVAKAKDFERVNSLLMSKADALERFENQLAELVALWGGEEVEIGKKLVHYPTSFEAKGLYDELDIAAKLQLLQAPEKVRGEQFRELVQKLFEGRAESELEELDSAVKSWEVDLKKQRELTNQPAVSGGNAKPASSGKSQSNTKARQENRRKESDQATGQKE